MVEDTLDLPRERDAQGRSRYERRVRDLTAPGHRGSGTDRERRAAGYLQAELKQLGVASELEPFRGSTAYGAQLLVPVGVAAVGAVLLGWLPAAASLLGAMALFSLMVEHTPRGRLLSRLVATAPSQNVVARIPAATGLPRLRLVVSAHYDSQRTGLLWHPRAFRCMIPVLTRSPALFRSPVAPVSAAMAVQTCAGVAALAGWITPVVPVLSGVLLLVYGMTGLLLANWAASAFVPGAADNASGVAGALAVGEGWLAEPLPDVELVLLFTGCEETGLLGASAWADRHREENAAVPTVFLNLDALGAGPPRFLGTEVPLAGLPLHYPAELVRATQGIAAEEGLAAAGPHTAYGPTDGLVFLARGLRGITVAGFQDDGYLLNYHLPTDTADRMDFDSAWRGVRFARRLLRRIAALPGNASGPDGR